MTNTTSAPSSWLNYWKPDQFLRHLQEGGNRLDHIASAQLARMGLGDTAWIVSALNGRLHTLGPIAFTTPLLSDSAARKILGRGIFESQYHLVVPYKEAEAPRLLDLSKIAARLRFEGPRDRLTVKSGLINGQQLQTMRRLTPESAALVEKLWGAPIKSHEVAFQKTTEALTKIKAADKAVLAKQRTEQAQLRRLLFRAAPTSRCCICGREFPVSLLVAAHIKPRNLCTKAERSNWKSNVVPMCVFGCDALFERGYITVHKGKPYSFNGHTFPVSVRKYIVQICSNQCPEYNEKTSPSFRWHHKHWSKSPTT